MRTYTQREERKLDCLIVPGVNGREQFEGYITNGFVQGMVIFPIQGEPTYLVWIGGRITRNIENVLRGGISWVEDWRAGASAEHVVAVLKEKGFDSATIGKEEGVEELNKLPTEMRVVE